MKKLLSLMLSAAMLMLVIPQSVSAQETAEILKSVKERVDIPESLDKFESSSYEAAESGTVYNFRWYTENEDEKLRSISVNCTDNEIITSYSRYEKKDRAYENQPSFPKGNTDELLKTAQSFADRLNPGAEIRAERGKESLYGTEAHFNLKREKNGIEVVGDNGSISVDYETGEVSRFYISWTELDEFEASDNVISADEAERMYNEKLGFEMLYNFYTEDKKIIFYPVYAEKNSRQYISAVTGEVIQPKKYIGATDNKTESAQDTAAGALSGGSNGFTAQEEENLNKLSNLITKENIEKRARDNGVIDISSAYELKNISLTRNYYDEDLYIYDMYFADKDNNSVSVKADAKNGDIYEISENGRRSKSTKTDEIQKALKKLAPSVSEKYKPDGSDLFRYENGIKVNSDKVYAWVDENGNINGFYVNYTSKAEFIPTDGAIGIEEASKKIFDDIAYTLKYYPDAGRKAYLAYSFDNEINFSALKGVSVGYNNEETDSGVYEYSDLTGHYAKEKIERLSEFGIGFQGDKFLPDEYISSSDFYAVMSNIFDGALNEKNEITTEYVSRNEAAVFMIRLMGAEKYAKYSDIYTQPYKDVEENRGYISLLSAMGVVSGDDEGNFNPDKLITRAETAVMIYNYLNR